MTTQTAHVAERPAGGSTRVLAARRAVSVLSWILLALIALQVYFAGLFLFQDGDYMDAHQGLGWSMTYLPFLTLIAMAFGKMSRGQWLSFAILFVLIHVQPFLALVSDQDGYGWVAALHPVNTIPLALLAYRQARWKTTG